MEAATGIWKEVDDYIKKQNIPLHMMIEVTRKCNVSCVHCYNMKDKAFLTLEEIDDIFKQLREAGTLFVTLTGGEIFARPDACDILYLARKYGFDIRLISNGTMITKEKAKILADVNVLEIGISVLGATEEVHDELARMPGAFERTIRGIKNCLEVGVPVHMKTTLMNENFHQFKDLIKLAESLGIHYMLDPIVTPRDDGDTDNLKYRLKDEYIEEFYFDHFKALLKDDSFEVDDEPEPEVGLPCDAGTGFGSISAEGKIYPCIQMPREIGNIKHDRFKDVWEKSTFLHELRSVKRDKFDNCSTCTGACNRCAGMAYLETGNPFGSSSIACTIGDIYRKFEAHHTGKPYMPKEPCGSHCSCVK